MRRSALSVHLDKFLALKQARAKANPHFGGSHCSRLAASARCATLKRKKVTPHAIRHGTAMAMLDAGVDIAVIALWLGHESIETTSVYLHTSLAMKEKALARLSPTGTPFRRFRPDDSLLSFLQSL